MSATKGKEVKKLRLVKLEGDKIEANKPYLLCAIAVPIPQPPGTIPEIGKPPPIQMNMAPCRAEFYDDETGESEEVEIEDAPRIQMDL